MLTIVDRNGNNLAAQVTPITTKAFDAVVSLQSSSRSDLLRRYIVEGLKRDIEALETDDDLQRTSYEAYKEAMFRFFRFEDELEKDEAKVLAGHKR